MMKRNRWWFSLLGVGVGLACTDPSLDSGNPLDSDSDSAHDSAVETGNLDSNHPIQSAYFVVHMEPGSPVDPVVGGINHSRAESHLEHLVQLTELADAQSHKLTLMLSPQWASYLRSAECDQRLLEDEKGTLDYGDESLSSCLDLIREMDASGHELALHHHPLEAASGWDGYTDDSEWSADRDQDGVDEVYFSDGGGPHGPDPFYLGTLADMMALIDAIPAGGKGHILSATTEEFPDSVRYSAAGGYLAYESKDDPGHLVSNPCAASYDGHGVWQLNMRLFTTDSGQRTVLDTELHLAMDDHETAEHGPYSLGFITHAKNVDETGNAHYEELFSELNGLNISLQRLSDVMVAYSRTMTDPLSAEDTVHCAGDTESTALGDKE